MDIKNILEQTLQDLIDDKIDSKKSKAICELSAQIIYKDRLAVEEKINNARIRYWDKK